MTSKRDTGWQYYRENYPDYAAQNPPAKIGFYRRLAEKALSDTDHPRVLEMGCAFGLFLDALPSGWQCFGTDINTAAIHEAAKNTPDAQFAIAGGEAPPFTRQFHLVAAFDVLEHIYDLGRTAEAIRDCLLPGGAFLFTVPVYDGPTGPVIRRLDHDPTHIHKESRRFWLEWCSRHFALREWYGVYRYLLPAIGYLHLPTRLLRHATPAITVLAQVN